MSTYEYVGNGNIEIGINVTLDGFNNRETNVKVFIPYLNKNVQVVIPNTIKEGQKLRLKGLGIESEGRIGDLYLKINKVKDTEERFSRTKKSGFGVENARIEERLQNVKNFYLKLDKIIDNLPDEISEEKKEMIKKKVLGDKELKKLMDGIDSNRPPRIFLIGRTGVGKSSLINALCGGYVAEVSDTKSCTEHSQIYSCKDNDRVLMEILDTRGIAESRSLNDSINAEDMLINEINEFSPDVAILMLNCTHRDDINSDVEFLKQVSKEYASVNKVYLPIVVVINKCDGVAPSRFTHPLQYPERKRKNIEEIVKYYKQIIIENGLKINDIIAVSSLIDWQTPGGEEVSVEDIKKLPRHDIQNLQIAFDGRYQIEELLDILENAIIDFEAQMGLRMAARLDEVVKRIARHLTKLFSTIAAVVAITPIPISDIYILLILQSTLVSLIAALSGRELSFKMARDFIFSIGGVGGLGYGFKIVAQQASKLLNGILPVTGSAVSSLIASTGTSMIGKAAIAYYIEGNTLEETKRKMEEIKKENKK